MGEVNRFLIDLERFKWKLCLFHILLAARFPLLELVQLTRFFVVGALAALGAILFQHELFCRVDLVSARHIVLAFADGADEGEQ